MTTYAGKTTKSHSIHELTGDHQRNRCTQVKAQWEASTPLLTPTLSIARVVLGYQTLSRPGFPLWQLWDPGTLFASTRPGYRHTGRIASSQLEGGWQTDPGSHQLRVNPQKGRDTEAPGAGLLD